MEHNSLQGFVLYADGHCCPGINKTVFRSPQDLHIAICRVTPAPLGSAIVGREYAAGCLP